MAVHGYTLLWSWIHRTYACSGVRQFLVHGNHQPGTLCHIAKGAPLILHKHTHKIWKAPPGADTAVIQELCRAEHSQLGWGPAEDTILPRFVREASASVSAAAVPTEHHKWCHQYSLMGIISKWCHDKKYFGKGWVVFFFHLFCSNNCGECERMCSGVISLHVGLVLSPLSAIEFNVYL